MNKPHSEFTRRRFLARLSLPALVFVGSRAGAADTGAVRGSETFNVRRFGARGDGTTLDTSALQKAIDECAQTGGLVLVPPGRYLSGTIFLRSHVTLEFEPGATLLGSTNLEHYPSTVSSVRSYTDNYTERSLIFGERLEQIGLQGRGIIDGQGAAFKGAYKVRPYLIRFIECQDVAVRGVTLKNSPMWVQHYLACEGVLIDGITVQSKCNGNNDGIDIDGCERVRISNCDIQSGDDAIVLKSTLARPCKNVVVSNCLLSSDCNAFKLGTESNGGFQNIVMSNCAIWDTRLAGIALELVDGGVLDRVTISNVTMDKVRGPIFIRLGDRGRPFQEGTARPGIGSLRNVSISNIEATGADRTGCCLAGIPGHPIENVTLSNIRLEFGGGGKEAASDKPVPENVQAYPEYDMFGPLPAYGFYCRHALNLVLDNIDVRTQAPDERAGLVVDDIKGLWISGWRAPAERPPVMQFQNVSNAMVSQCRGAMPGNGPYLKVSGKDSSNIEVDPTEILNYSNGVSVGPEVPPDAVKIRMTPVK